MIRAETCTECHGIGAIKSLNNESWMACPVCKNGVTIHNDLKIPICDVSDPASLESWYGPFSFFDHWRKVVLANCREIERARAVERQEKITESRLDDLARVSDIYVSFLTIHLGGREMRENMVKQEMGR